MIDRLAECSVFLASTHELLLVNYCDKYHSSHAAVVEKSRARAVSVKKIRK
jgi:hypothetical protein